MRADRLVSILLWLQVHGRTSAAELARRQEVSLRTIHRDMEALSAAGVPVFALRGRNGGWALPAEYRLSSKWLSGEEVRALAVLTPAVVLADLGLAGTADAAWLKLLAALPPPHRDEATFVHERIHVDTSTWQPRRETLPWLPALKEAVFTEHQVQLRYRLSDGGLVDRRIAPLGLVAKGQSWYVVGEIDSDIRSYRISRIEGVHILPERFARPAGFDLAGFWEASKQRLVEGLPRYPVTLLVDPTAIEQVRRGLRWGRVTEVAPPGEDGRRSMTIMFEIYPDALASVLGFGDRVEVVAPPDFRVAVRGALGAALGHYLASDGPAACDIEDDLGEDGAALATVAALDADSVQSLE
jgi:predicted DNA-binding transcriptional regulator YafY